MYDTLGNVWEWVNDYWDIYPNRPSQDPMGPSSGQIGVSRGGSWISSPRFVRASYRGRVDPGIRNYDEGFRCVGEANIP